MRKRSDLGWLLYRPTLGDIVGLVVLCACLLICGYAVGAAIAVLTIP